MRDECKHGNLKRQCEICDLEDTIAAKDKRIAALKAEIANMKEHTWCAYCGHEIHIDDEAATKISEHIMTCEKHPIQIALKENNRQAEEIKRLSDLYYDLL